MHNRRHFIKQSAVAAVAGVFVSKNALAMFHENAQHAIGLQLFFVEHDMPKDAYASIKESYQYLTNVVKV